jgi:gamma-glutamyltranspeptidase/glutathione hydrolase
MVVAAERNAAEAGAAILRAGGNATDAAVATAFALAVTWPTAGNLGGGGFWISTDRKGRSFAVDFRECAPAASSPDMFERAAATGRKEPSLRGALASGVPGSVAGLAAAHRRGGRLPWHDCLAPAMRLARDGFPMSGAVRESIAKEEEKLREIPAAAAIFLPGGRLPEVGALFRQPDLARVLERIGREGPAGFSRGPVARALVAWQRRNGGVLTLRDLASYSPRFPTPFRFRFAGAEVVTMPLPSGGPTLAQMAAMVEAIGLERFAADDETAHHLLAEIERRAFLDRNRFLGDPAFVPSSLRILLAPEYVRALANGIDPLRATATRNLLGREVASRPPESTETTHFSVVDRSGSAVAVTTTLNDRFGSGEVVPGLGFLLNDEMDDFTAHPGRPNLFGLVQGGANAVAPGKRPLSSMCPSIARKDGRVRLVWGSPGGSTIPTTNLQILWRVLVRGESLASAQQAPRLHHQDFPDALDYEAEVALPLLARLEAMGHPRGRERSLGRVDAIEVLGDGTRIGVTDPRGGGGAAAE